MRGTAPGSVEGVKQRPLAVALVAVGVVALAVTIGLLLPRAVTPPPPLDSEGLRAAVTAEALKGHLDALQQAADANGGNRAAGTPGFAASADYVAGRLEAAGYQVQRQQFSYDRPDYSQATLQQRSPTVRRCGHCCRRTRTTASRAALTLAIRARHDPRKRAARVRSFRCSKAPEDQRNAPSDSMPRLSRRPSAG